MSAIATSVRLSSGQTVEIRPLRPTDRTGYRVAVDGLSAASVTRRFGGPRKRLSDREVDRFLDNGHDRRDALVAVDPGGGAVLGVARFAPSDVDPRLAELAVFVADAWQGLGLATALVHRLLEVIADAGFDGVRATSLEDNQAIAVVLRRAGLRAGGTRGGSPSGGGRCRSRPEPHPARVFTGDSSGPGFHGRLHRSGSSRETAPVRVFTGDSTGPESSRETPRSPSLHGRLLRSWVGRSRALSLRLWAGLV